MMLAFAVSLGLLVSGAALAFALLLRSVRKPLEIRLAGGSGGIRRLLGDATAVVVRGRNKPKFVGDKRQQIQVLLELPDLLDYLAVAVSAGESFYAALQRLAPRSNGLVAAGLARVIRRIELGETLNGALDALAIELPQPPIAEFTSKVSLALRRGTPLAQLLRDQADSVRAELRSQMLRAAGRNETRMLIPLIFLILPITVLFATYPSLQLLQLTL